MTHMTTVELYIVSQIIYTTTGISLSSVKNVTGMALPMEQLNTAADGLVLVIVLE